MTRRSVTVVTLRYNSWWNRRWLYPRFRSFPCAGKMTESHYTIAHYYTKTGRFDALGLQLSAACTRVTISEPKTGSKRVRAASGVQISFFFWTEKGFQCWNGGIGCLRGWGNLRIFTRNGRRGADFHMLAGRKAAARAYWNRKRLLNWFKVQRVKTLIWSWPIRLAKVFRAILLKSSSVMSRVPLGFTRAFLTHHAQ